MPGPAPGTPDSLVGLGEGRAPLARIENGGADPGVDHGLFVVDFFTLPKGAAQGQGQASDGDNDRAAAEQEPRHEKPPGTQVREESLQEACFPDSWWDAGGRDFVRTRVCRGSCARPACGARRASRETGFRCWEGRGAGRLRPGRPLRRRCRPAGPPGRWRWWRRSRRGRGQRRPGPAPPRGRSGARASPRARSPPGVRR